MKQKLLELHTLPRQVLETEIQRIGCSKNGQFNMADQGCWGCEVGAECVSMLKVSLDGKTSSGHLSMGHLKSSLLVAKRFIDDLIQRKTHTAGVCGCELCNWSLQADFVLSASVPDKVKPRVVECAH